MYTKSAKKSVEPRTNTNSWRKSSVEIVTSFYILLLKTMALDLPFACIKARKKINKKINRKLRFEIWFTLQQLISKFLETLWRHGWRLIHQVGMRTLEKSSLQIVGFFSFSHVRLINANPNAWSNSNSINPMLG